jgi:hypothetical protein
LFHCLKLLYTYKFLSVLKSSTLSNGDLEMVSRFAREKTLGKTG